MQTYDILMVAVLGISTLFGAIKGFAWQVASLASLFVSYFVAYSFRGDVAKMIHAQEPWNGFLAMLLLYAGSSFAIWLVFRLVSGSIDAVRLRDFDRHLGALMGFCKGAIYCLLVTMFAVTLLGPRQQQAIVDSRSGGYIAKMLAAADGIVWPKEIQQIVGPYIENVERKFEHRGESTPFPNTPLNNPLDGISLDGIAGRILGGLEPNNSNSPPNNLQPSFGNLPEFLPSPNVASNNQIFSPQNANQYPSSYPNQDSNRGDVIPQNRYSEQGPSNGFFAPPPNSYNNGQPISAPQQPTRPWYGQ